MKYYYKLGFVGDKGKLLILDRIGGVLYDTEWLITLENI